MSDVQVILTRIDIRIDIAVFNCSFSAERDYEC